MTFESSVRYLMKSACLEVSRSKSFLSGQSVESLLLHIVLEVLNTGHFENLKVLERVNQMNSDLALSREQAPLLSMIFSRVNILKFSKLN